MPLEVLLGGWLELLLEAPRLLGLDDHGLAAFDDRRLVRVDDNPMNYLNISSLLDCRRRERLAVAAVEELFPGCQPDRRGIGRIPGYFLDLANGHWAEASCYLAEIVSYFVGCACFAATSALAWFGSCHGYLWLFSMCEAFDSSGLAMMPV